MEQYKTNVTVIMEFLKSEGFSSSVQSEHRLCYKDLQDYLSASGVSYSHETAYQWMENNKSAWNYRKFTGWRHCVDQLEDVYAQGYISPDHLGPRTSAYMMLDGVFKTELDCFLHTGLDHPDDDRYRIACARFLLFLQRNGLQSIDQLDYEMLLRYHKEDYHKSSASKDVYEDLIRVFLKHLAVQGKCTVGFSLALNKLLIHQIVRLPDDERFTGIRSGYPEITWPAITAFLKSMESVRYGKTVLRSTEHILTLLYIFLDMHQIPLSEAVLWRWFEQVKPLLGSGWKQHRRSLCQFLHFLKTGEILTAVSGDPAYIPSIDRLPLWASTPLLAYLSLLKREGWQKSTVTMHQSSNMRFCRYLHQTGLDSFEEVTPSVLQAFHLQDIHATPDGKAAYNCRIRSFLIYLYEQKVISDPFLYKSLPTFTAPKLSIVQTLSREEVSSIWAVNPETLPPKALRDYAMVCIGLSMGFRASDIVALKFQNIDWRQRSISLIQQKTGKALVMPMPVKTGNVLFRYLRDGRPKSPDPHIFIRHEAPYGQIQSGVCRTALKRFLPKDRVSDAGFHIVRKTFATGLLKGSVKVELISDSLGHSTDGTVHKYLFLDEDRMRQCPLSLADLGISFKGGVFHA